MSLTQWPRIKLFYIPVRLIISQRLCHDISIKNDKSLESDLQKGSEDLSSVTPHYSKTFNIAAYVNSSKTLQNLLHLKVDISKIEKKPFIVEKLLKLNFEDNIKTHIFFLKDYVEEDSLGAFITKNPMILCECIENLSVRINYLKSKSFSDEQMRKIITKNPFWLMLSTTRIDGRLGFFQEQFDLNGDQIRYLASKQPKLITYNLHHVKTNSFIIKEELGFEDEERKQLLLMTPKLWMLNQKALLERFNYIHNIMKISHKVILQNSHVLLSRNFRVKQRHMFLEKLGRAQYDPTKENYVPIMALVEDTDIEFCIKYSKCNVLDFNTFLKTL